MEVKAHHTNSLQSIVVMAQRNLLKTLHNPDNLMDVLIEPVLFMILFGYLFGGAIAGSVKNYLPIIVPGILVQTILSAASGSGSQIREDMDSGIFDRFKSLPISRIAPLAGQLFADILRLIIATAASLITGFCMGWRPNVNFGWILVVALLASFVGWSISWIYAFIGLITKSATTSESISLMTMLLFSFLSNAFVPIKTLPKALQIIANINPVTYVITAIRQILKNGAFSKTAWLVIFSGFIIVIIFAPLTVWAYNKQK